MVSHINPTFRCLIASERDARLLVEACLEGYLNHLPRKPCHHEETFLPRAGHVYIFEENALGFAVWSDPFHWIPIPSATGIKTFMAIPSPLYKLSTAAFESHSTTHYLVAYQPVDNVKINWLKRPSEYEQLRDLQPRKDLCLKIDTEHDKARPPLRPQAPQSS